MPIFIVDLGNIKVLKTVLTRSAEAIITITGLQKANEVRGQGPHHWAMQWGAVCMSVIDNIKCKNNGGTRRKREREIRGGRGEETNDAMTKRIPSRWIQPNKADLLLLLQFYKAEPSEGERLAYSRLLEWEESGIEQREGEREENKYK